jgi:L-ascorbate metabolism protein UlaG (beta-lactamase superfamily)
MEIAYLGHSSFRIKTKKAVIVTDPYDPYLGFKMPKVKADAVTVSHDHRDHNFVEAVLGTKDHPQPFIIDGPGEYEISEVFILGMASFHDQSLGKKRGKNTIYLITADEIKLCHLGDLGHKLLEKQVEELNQVDVLLVPVGGVYTIGPQKAHEVIDQIDPKIVIPMHYQLPGLTLKLAPVEEFLTELEVEKKKPLEKLSVKAGSLPEEREAVVLKWRR